MLYTTPKQYTISNVEEYKTILIRENKKKKETWRISTELNTHTHYIDE